MTETLVGATRCRVNPYPPHSDPPCIFSTKALAFVARSCRMENMKSRPKTIEIPSLGVNEIAKAQSRVDAFTNAMSAFVSDIIDNATEAFYDLGGCPHCKGRGWNVTWDTLDSLSGCYAEYEVCPHCTEEQRNAVGFVSPEYFSKYDRNRDGRTFESWLIHMFGMNDVGRQYEKLYTMLKDDLAKATADLEEAREHFSIRKGVKVRVVRERGNTTAPMGTEGRVFWVGVTTYGRYGYRTSTCRLGLKDEHGTIFWTTEKNCELVDPNPEIAETVTVKVACYMRDTLNAKLFRFMTDVAGETVEAWIPKDAIKIEKLNTGLHENKLQRLTVDRWWYDQNPRVALV